jgi:Matrixin
MNYKQRRRFLWALFLIGLALIAVVANATTLARLRFDDMVQEASAIARVQCLSSESVWQNGEIWTRTQLEVLEENKGLLPGIVTVEMPGGVIGNLHARVEEVPRFRPGEEAYVILWRQPGQAYRVLGWTQGTFRISRDARSGLEADCGFSIEAEARSGEVESLKSTSQRTTGPQSGAKEPRERGRKVMRIMEGIRQSATVVLAAFYALWAAPMAQAYAFNEIVPDVRQPVSVSGGSACPVRAHQVTAAGSVAVRWSTALNTNPVTILTLDQTAAGQPNEIEQVIQQSLAVWTGVSGTTLTPATLAPLARTGTQNACGTDGVNSICFDQPDMGFTPGVLAFTRVVIADGIGQQVGSSAVSTAPGQILDADIYFNPSDPHTTFATPAALSANATAYDLESVLTHELGHLLGFSHSDVWSAMMYPYAPTPGTFTGARPTLQQPDAPLGEDDRTGLRVLYPDPNDTLHTGAIQGRILPANPLSLPASPPGVTGVFGAQVVAVDAASGAVVGGAIGGWSCADPGPTQFDGSYAIERLAIGHSYLVYAEPLNGAVAPAQIGNATATLCRNSATDAGWPPLQGCVVPAVNTSFTARTLPGP